MALEASTNGANRLRISQALHQEFLLQTEAK